MALTFNLRHLERKPLHLQGELSPEELDLAGVDDMIEVSQAVQYDLVLERLGQDILVRGSLQCALQCECVRCLRTFTDEIVLEDWACDLPLEGEDQVTVANDCVDLTPYLREDILLAFPQHPLCEPGCRGLLDTGLRATQPASVDQAREASVTWAALNKLKF